jgi:hypothetical protein
MLSAMCGLRHFGGKDADAFRLGARTFFVGFVLSLLLGLRLGCIGPADAAEVRCVDYFSLRAC